MTFTTMLACTLAYGLACLGAGAAARRGLGSAMEPATPLSPLAALASDFLLGSGLLACGWMALALAGWFSPLALGAALVLSLYGAWRYSRAPAVAACRQAHSIFREFTNYALCFQILIVLTLLWILAGFTAFGRALSGDALGLHMLIPKVVADSHLLTERFLNVRVTYFGLQGEMQHAALLAMGSADAAKLFSWPTMMAGALILISVCGACGMSRPGKWLALLALYTSTAVLWWIAEGKIDIYATALGLGAVRWVMPDRRSRSDLAIAGVLAACTVQAKLAYALTLMPALAFIYAWPGLVRWFSGAGAGALLARGTLLTLLAGGAGFAVAMAPHAAKNLLFFGNLAGTIELATLPSFLEEPWYSEAVRTRIQLAYPLVLSYGDFFAQGGNLSPMVLAFLPLAVLLWKGKDALVRSPLTPLSLAPLLAVVPWMLAQPDKVALRYLLVPLLLWIPLAARAAEGAALPIVLPETESGGWPRTSRWIAILLSILAGYFAWRILKYTHGLGRYFALSVLAFALLACWAAVRPSGYPRGTRALGALVMLASFVILVSVVYASTSFSGVSSTLGNDLLYPRQTIAYFRGRMPYCELQYEQCEVSEKLNQLAGRGERVFSNTAYIYFLRPDLIQCSSLPRELDILGMPDNAAVWSALRENGFQYLLIDARERHAKRVSALARHGQQAGGAVERIHEKGAVSVYRLRFPEGSPRPQMRCAQSRPPAWSVVR